MSKKTRYLSQIYIQIFFLIFFTRYNKFLIETDLCLHLILGIRLSIIFFLIVCYKLEVLFYGKLYVAMVRQLVCKFNISSILVILGTIEILMCFPRVITIIGFYGGQWHNKTQEMILFKVLSLSGLWGLLKNLLLFIHLRVVSLGTPLTLMTCSIFLALCS